MTPDRQQELGSLLDMVAIQSHADYFSALMSRRPSRWARMMARLMKGRR